MAEHKAFEGVKVCDFTQGVAGPHCTMLLALHGAEVVKIEPMEGDWGRQLGERRGEHCAHSIAFNRAKHSIALDLKSPAGMAIARKLADQADVVAESFRPGVMDRLGLGYKALSAANPKLIYFCVSGFGQVGPYNKRPTVDSLIQAFSGMMVMNRTADGVPHRQGMIAVDVLTGLYGFNAVSAALTRQFRFGEGSFIDNSMMMATAAFQGAKLMEHVLSHGKPPPLYVPAGMFKTADGYIVVSSMRQHHFKALCQVLGRAEYADDPRFATHESRIANATTINQALGSAFPSKTTADWLKLLHEGGVFAERVNNYDDYMGNEQVKAMGAVDWLEEPNIGKLPIANIPGLPPARDDAPARHAPNIGEHTRQILGGIGYGQAEVDRLIADRVVRAA
jgi:crotonobetainyl-CoA:carnitine CoA-transferase CaiB-like acyl-CoA transferase